MAFAFRQHLPQHIPADSLCMDEDMAVLGALYEALQLSIDLIKTPIFNVDFPFRMDFTSDNEFVKDVGRNNTRPSKHEEAVALCEEKLGELRRALVDRHPHGAQDMKDSVPEYHLSSVGFFRTTNKHRGCLSEDEVFSELNKKTIAQKEESAGMHKAHVLASLVGEASEDLINRLREQKIILKVFATELPPAFMPQQEQDSCSVATVLNL